MTTQPPRPGPTGPADDSAAPVSVWVPFRRLMLIVTLCAVVAVGVALAVLRATGAPDRWELWLAVSGGIAGTVLLTGALMGLVFLSNRSGHDDHIGHGD